MISLLRIFAVKLALNAVVLLLLTLIDGIWFDAVHWVVWPALGFVALNTFLPLLILLLRFTLNLPSLALFSLGVNAAALALFDWLLPPFHIAGLWANISGMIVIATANFLLNWYFLRQELRHSGSLR